MLRRAENVQALFQRDPSGLLTGQYRVLLQVGRKRYFRPGRLTVAEFREMERRSETQPVRYLSVGDRVYWRFQGKWHTDNDSLSPEDVHALLVTRAMRNAGRISRARTVAAQGQLPASVPRERIPDGGRQFVWQRDRGSCRGCGSNDELQFDHVIPLSHGGNNSAQNLQILCAPCNRRKSTGIV